MRLVRRLAMLGRTFARILDAEGEPISNGYTISLSAPNP